jgi:hypothetical protein
MRSFGCQAVRLLRSLIWLGLALIAGASSPLKLVADANVALDESRIQSAGIRKLTSEHLVLYTDVPSNPEVDRLPAVFDRAIPQWAAYFKIDESKAAKWHALAFLVGDARRFGALKLLPAGHEDFENGISSGSDIWLRDQPSDYYRRHLLLHEGTHAFMVAFLGGCGPGWYMEGIAELLGTHRFDEKSGALTLGVMPRRREQVPMLGRIKLIRDAVADHRALSFPSIMQLDNRKQLGSEAYAWCWATAKFLDASPRYRDRFRQLRTIVNDPKFNEIFREKFAPDWSDLNAEWRAYVSTLDYGFDFDRMAIEFQAGSPLVGETQSATISAEHGWQSSGLLLQAGKSYVISAAGHYQIATERRDSGERPWPCEPGGITIAYQDGRPLGILLGAIDARDEHASSAKPSFAEPVAIGLHATIKPSATGTLYLRVNDSPAKLDDNRGNLTVTIRSAH